MLPHLTHRASPPAVALVPLSRLWCAGSRASVFAQTVADQCVACNASFYQNTAGSTTCDFCGTAPQGATTCPTTCPDGTQGDPKAVGGCVDCPVGTYRSGDMPVCIAVSAFFTYTLNAAALCVCCIVMDGLHCSCVCCIVMDGLHCSCIARAK
jgi:hypothetical protein